MMKLVDYKMNVATTTLNYANTDSGETATVVVENSTFNRAFGTILNSSMETVKNDYGIK